MNRCVEILLYYNSCMGPAARALGRETTNGTENEMELKRAKLGSENGNWNEPLGTEGSGIRRRHCRTSSNTLVTACHDSDRKSKVVP